jgi:hypothetical protein
MIEETVAINIIPQVSTGVMLLSILAALLLGIDSGVFLVVAIFGARVVFDCKVLAD